MTEEDLDVIVEAADVIPGLAWLWVALGLVVAVMGAVAVV